ncbi:unnamed protein product [Symbiodinium natans]|uniref:Uncharacterized protein n=1 Tax=Symbiodinium natans TaxID=878477 RepID=A0A812LG50_9DINO|nr:unnamed protein product [Symbiodinium natans]
MGQESEALASENVFQQNHTLTSLVHEAAKAPLSDHQIERLHHLDRLHYAELHQDQDRDQHCQEREQMARDEPDHWSLHHEDINAYMDCLCVQRKPSLVCEAIHHEGMLDAADHAVQLMQEHFDELNADKSQQPPIAWHRGMSELQTYSNSSQELGFAIPLGPCDADALACNVCVKGICLSVPFPKAGRICAQQDRFAVRNSGSVAKAEAVVHYKFLGLPA